MAKVHILESDANGNYRVVMHIAMPNGNNTAGKTWKSVALESGVAGNSILVVGTDPGNITQTEMDNITAGDVLEFVETIPAETGGASTTSLGELVDKAIANRLAILQARYKYYGYTQN